MSGGRVDTGEVSAQARGAAAQVLPLLMICPNCSNMVAIALKSVIRIAAAAPSVWCVLHSSPHHTTETTLQQNL